MAVSGLLKRKDPKTLFNMDYNIIKIDISLSIIPLYKMSNMQIE